MPDTSTLSLDSMFSPTYQTISDVGVMVEQKTRKIESLTNGEHYILLQTDNGYVFLHSGDTFSVIDKYEVYGGFNNPFEYIVLTMKIKRLESQVPQMFTRDRDGNVNGDLCIHAGYSKLLLRGRACGAYTISNIKVNDETLTITAYTHFEELRSKILQEGLKNCTILEALEEAFSRCGISAADIAGNVYTYNPQSNTGTWDVGNLDNYTDRITIPHNAYAWRIIQICVIHMGCKIFFTGTKCYIVNYSKSDDMTVLNNVHLHKPTDSVNKLDKDDLYLSVWDCCTTRISSPSNSSDSVKTTMAVRIENGEIVVGGISTAVSQSDATTAMSLSEYSDEDSARHFCQGAVKYTLNASKCVKFTLNESMYEVIGSGDNKVEIQGFERNILDPARADRIWSDYNEANYTNKNKDGTPNPLNLLLSSVEMDYPMCNTTYTFGENKPISLDSSLSEIRSAK